jgi:hypothetical protein
MFISDPAYHRNVFDDPCHAGVYPFGGSDAAFLANPLRDTVRAAFEEVNKQREEILKAFVAKYGCEPDQIVQYEQITGRGVKWWFEVKK